MKHTYNIDGMTCNGCKATVTKSISGIEGVSNVKVDLADKSASVEMIEHIDLATFQDNLPKKFDISQRVVQMNSTPAHLEETQTKIQQLKPLLIILFYITTASVLLHRDDMNISAILTDFMGLFFIVFSFFKLLDIKGFASSFAMYDPIAKIIPAYGNVYPFIETILGIMLLLRFNIPIALIATIIILGFTTFGVTKTLLAKRTIKCACLGTALNLPMTEATFIENAIMIVMSLAMLVM